MQIQYCDDCGTRVDESESITIDGKCYCQQCAPRHAVGQRRVSPSTGTSQRTTARLPRQARLTPSRNSAKITAPATAPEADPQEFDNEALPPQSPPTFSVVAYRWSKRNPALAMAFGLGLLGVLLFSLWRFSGPSKLPGGRPVIANTVPKPTQDVTVALQTTNATTVVATTGPATTIAKTGDDSESGSPRENMAAREWKTIKELATKPNANPFDLRKRLERLVAPDWIQKTPLGIEAAKMLEKYKSEKRPPDSAEGAVPGVIVALSDDKAKAEEVFNTAFAPTDFKTAKDINFPNVGTLKAAFGRDTNVAMKFTGFIEVPKDGEYTFYINSDDGSMLYLGEWLLISNGGSHPMTERDGTVDLKKGKHAFRLDYYNGTSLAGMQFSWSGPGIVKQIVPASALSSIKK